jgi:hypothetical protein
MESNMRGSDYNFLFQDLNGKRCCGDGIRNWRKLFGRTLRRNPHLSNLIILIAI